MSLSGFMVRSRLGDYGVFFEAPGQYLPKLAADPACVFVVDENVWHLHKNSTLKPLTASPHIILPISEIAKSLDSAQMLYDRLLESPRKKNTRLVSIGGGITQDITGFAASTLYRGIKWTFIPTTLLAQADSCIGGKTSLNYKKYKNLIGTFYPPSEIYISAEFVSTLKEQDYLSGLGEIAKLCIIGGRSAAEDFAASLDKLLARDEETVLGFLRTALEIKKGYIEDDEFDSGRRNILNFGHCFGHALESASEFALPHGIAVVYGMLLANIAARRRALLPGELESFLRDSILAPIVRREPYRGPLTPDLIVEAMKQDKKRVGAKLALVMAGADLKMCRVGDLEEREAVDAIVELNGSREKPDTGAGAGPGGGENV